MTLAIMSAMPEENASLVQSMTVDSSTKIGQRTYFQGQLWGQSVVVVFSRWGKVAAASTAVTLIERFKASEIIFVGVAGAIDPELTIGDVVIGNNFYQHDLDARPMLARHEIPLIGVTSIESDSQRRNELLRAAILFAQQQIRQEVPADVLKQYSLNSPQVVEGGIASGDQFISNASDAMELKQRLPDVVCVEMEGASVAQVCLEHETPFSVLRVISDSANSEADINFQSFVQDVARIYSCQILKNMFEGV